MKIPRDLSGREVAATLVRRLGYRIVHERESHKSLIELSPRGIDERTLLESLSNHVHAKGVTPEDLQATLAFGDE